jgi:hypothetical protein
VKLLVQFVVMVVVVAACDLAGDAATTTVGQSTSTTLAATPATATTSTTTTTTTTLAAADDAPCSVGETAFSTERILATFGVSLGDAEQLSAVRWAEYDDCERFVLDFLTSDGAPASIMGDTSVTLLSEFDIIRITLPNEVTATQINDVLVDTTLVDRAYVVRLDDTALAVDVHLKLPTQARAFGLPEPARSVVDIRPREGAADPLTPAISNRLVVLASPSRSGQDIVLAGYSWNGESVKVTYAGETTTLRPISNSTTTGNPGWYWFAGSLDRQPIDGTTLTADNGLSTVELRLGAS